MKLLHQTLLALAALTASIAVSAQNTLYVGNVKDADNLSSIPNEGYRGVATYISPDIVGKYAGSKVVGLRVALGATAFTSLRAWLSADPNPDKPLTDLATGTATSLTDGWNDIAFATPYTITGKEDELYAGFYMTYANTDDRPVLVSTARNNYGLLIYETGSYGAGWYDYSSTGSLAVQLILEGSNLPDYDVALTDFSTDSHYYKTDAEQMQFHVNVQNNGTKAIVGITLDVRIDGRDDLGGQLVIDEEIASTKSLMQALPIAGYNLAPGQHTISLSVKELAGGATVTDGTTDDDAVQATFAIYKNASTRQASLLEVYAHQYSSYDPLQTQAIEQLMQTRSDVIPVFIHADWYGDDYPDEFALPEAMAYGLAFGLEETPSIAFNRVVIPGATAMLQEINASTIQSGYLGAMLDYINEVSPAFASVNITAAISDDDHSKLVLTVTGTRGEDFLNIFNAGALTVMLTEDSLVATQANGEEMQDSYVHNHVLRHVASAIAGDDIAWSGLRFTRTYTVDIRPEWKLQNMHAVAFIAKAITDDSTLDNVDITCAAQTNIADAIPAAVHGIDMAATTAATVYDLAGRRAIAFARPGIYLRAGKKAISR